MTHEEFQRAIDEVQQERRASLKDAERFLETMKLHGYSTTVKYEGQNMGVDLCVERDYVGHVLFCREKIVVFPMGREEILHSNPPDPYEFALTIAGLFPSFD